MDAWAEELRGAGRRPFTLPIGGSTGLGALGAVNAARELAAQLGPGPVQLVAAVGSCGTFAGLRLGAELFLPGSRVIGVSVSRTADRVRARTMELAAESAARLGIDLPFPAASLECHDEWSGEYGVATPADLEAIGLAARLEGLLLDPVYTGKSMAGLVALSRGRALDPSVPVVFLHAGGLPIVFAYDELASGAACAKIPRR